MLKCRRLISATPLSLVLVESWTPYIIFKFPSLKLMNYEIMKKIEIDNNLEISLRPTRLMLPI